MLNYIQSFFYGYFPQINNKVYDNIKNVMLFTQSLINKTVEHIYNLQIIIRTLFPATGGRRYCQIKRKYFTVEERNYLLIKV